MARQKGTIMFTGTLGGLTFYYDKNHGYLARKKTGVDTKRIREDDAFARTRENSAEFGRAAKAAKLLRTALHEVLMHKADPLMANRLTQTMVKVLKADHLNERGKRTITQGQPELLEGFEFNEYTPFNKTFSGSYTITYNSGLSQVLIAFDKSIDKPFIRYPEGATHLRIVSFVVSVDFAILNSIRSRAIPQNKTISLSDLPVSFEPIVHEVIPLNKAIIFVLLGIEFYQQTGGELLILHDRQYNSMRIEQVFRMA